MNTPVLVPDLTNDAIVDFNPEVNQRARTLLSSIAAKREQLERHQKSAGTTTKHGNALVTTKVQSAAMTTKIQEALREKRDRLLKHLRLEATPTDDHQDNTQTTETSTATPGASPCILTTHFPSKMEVGEASDCSGLANSNNVESATMSAHPMEPINFLPLSKSFDETRSPKRTGMIRRTSSFDGDVLIRKLLAVSNSRRNKDELVKTTSKNLAITEMPAAGCSDSLAGKKLTEAPISKTRNSQEHARERKKILPSKQRLGTRSRSFDTTASRPRNHSPRIKLSMSLDSSTSHNTLVPRGDRSRRMMSLNDIELPLEISPIDTRSSKEVSNKATISRRTGSKLIETSLGIATTGHQECTLKTKEERKAYIDNLYRTASKLHMQTAAKSPRERKKDKAELDRQIIKAHQEEKLKAQNTPVVVVGHNYDTSNSNGEDLMKLSLQDDSDRREMLRRLQLDLNRPKPMAKMMEVARQAALDNLDGDSSTEEYLSFSDDSSCDFTTTSEITGIGSLIPPNENGNKKAVSFADQLSRPEENNRKEIIAGTMILHGVPTDSIDISQKSESSRTAEKDAPLLLVDVEEADMRCRAMGGLFDIAKRSGFDRLAMVPLEPLPRSHFMRPQIRLSTDYRCGTYGSSYDIALRSGYLSDASTSTSARRKTEHFGKANKKEVRTTTKSRTIFARGSLYDIALQSGLTKQMLRTRSSFSFTVQYRLKGEKSCLLSTKDSDRRCGACGSVYLAATCIEKEVRPRNIFRGDLYSIQEVDD